jgi:predicted PurR-regulated permease PerM
MTDDELTDAPPEPGTPAPVMTAQPMPGHQVRGQVVAPPPTTPPAQIPNALRVAAGWSWRLLLIGVMVYFLARGFVLFQVLIVPVLIALLLVALVRPIHQALVSRPGRVGLPNGLAAIITVLITLAIIGGLVTLIGQQIATGFPNLRADAASGLTDLQQRLANSPLKLTSDQINTYVQQISDSLRGNSGSLVSGALQITSTAGHMVTGFFLFLFSGYFFLAGGEGIWGWLVGLFPRDARPRVRGAGTRAWATLTSFIRATLIVALVDGIGVGLGAAIIGVPLALPLGVLVFLGAFVPIVGALVSGLVAVLVALVAGGTVKALIMLLIVIAVQQVEAHALQPFLLGRAVQVHPLAVILAIGAGVVLAGIIGALFAVPLVAVINVVVSYLAGDEDDAEPRPDEEQVGPLADATEDDPEADREPEDAESLDGPPARSPATAPLAAAPVAAAPVAAAPVSWREKTHRLGRLSPRNRR